MRVYLSLNINDDANFFACQYCIKHFVIEVERDEHEKVCQEKEFPK